MKILFCDNSLKELINFRGDIIKNFLSKGYEVVLVAPNNYKNNKLLSSLKYYPIKMNRGGMNPFKDFSLFINILKIYKKEKPDYVFNYTIKPNIYGSIASKLLKIPSTSMVTGLGYAFNHNDLRSKVARKLYRVALNLNNNVIVLNQDNLDTLTKGKILKKEKAILLKGGEGVNLKEYK